MITDSAALVMFAIRSSIKLGQQMRRAYVESTQRRELVLPLPDFFATPDITSAANYFAGPGGHRVASSPTLGALLQKRRSPGQSLTEDEEAELCELHREFFNLDRAARNGLGVAPDGSTLDGEGFNALITIRQWRRGADPNPPVLQRLAGTFVEIGVDYLANVPGALNRDSRHGKPIAGFLEAMGDIRFSEEKLGTLPARLFVATLETVSEQSDLLSGDTKTQELVRVVTRSLSSDVARHIEQLRAGGGSDLVREARLSDWAETVFRSLLSSAGGHVLAHPERFLGVQEEAGAELVSRVGESVLGLLLDESGLSIDRLFSRQSVTRILRPALAVAGEHPDLFLKGNHAGFQRLLGEMATRLAGSENLLARDTVPEVMRLILEKTGENLPLLWPNPGREPGRHLLLMAAQTTLEVLSRPSSIEDVWSPAFGRTELITITDAVLDELAANPAWLAAITGKEDERLKLVLESALRMIRLRASPQLSPVIAADIVRAVVQASARRVEFLKPVSGDGTGDPPPLVAAVLDAILQAVFDPDLGESAAWQVRRPEVLLNLVKSVLAELAGSRPRAETVAVLEGCLRKQLAALTRGEAFDLPAFELALHKALTKKPARKKKETP
ncbi:MAG TPA: hypothetical protein VMS21_08150 [Methylomirabilota bacterium]|nr:hypothetical protein [Methylomirabilota bacterium]